MNMIIEAIAYILIAFAPFIAVAAVAGLGALLCPVRK